MYAYSPRFLPKRCLKPPRNKVVLQKLTIYSSFAQASDQGPHYASKHVEYALYSVRWYFGGEACFQSM
jgi:hypothetical protein